MPISGPSGAAHLRTASAQRRLSAGGTVPAPSFGVRDGAAAAPPGIGARLSYFAKSAKELLAGGQDGTITEPRKKTVTV